MNRFSVRQLTRQHFPTVNHRQTSIYSKYKVICRAALLRHAVCNSVWSRAESIDLGCGPTGRCFLAACWSCTRHESAAAWRPVVRNQNLSLHCGNTRQAGSTLTIPSALSLPSSPTHPPNSRRDCFAHQAMPMGALSMAVTFKHEKPAA